MSCCKVGSVLAENQFVAVGTVSCLFRSNVNVSASWDVFAASKNHRDQEKILGSIKLIGINKQVKEGRNEGGRDGRKEGENPG